MKRMYFGLFLGLLTSIGINSATATCDSCFEITIPEFCAEYDAKFTFLYLKPSASNLDYATATRSLPIDSPDWDVKSIKPQYSAGVELNLDYTIPCTGNNLELTWTHLQTRDTNAINASGSRFVTPIFAAEPQGEVFKSAKGRAAFHFDALNLTIGQFFDVGNCLRFRIFGGPAFARIEQAITNFYRNNSNNRNLRTHQNSNFTGGGILVGVNGSYQTCWGFSVIAEASGSVLAGLLERKMHFVSNSIDRERAGLSNPNFQSLGADDTTKVASSFDTKFGVNYLHEFCNGTTMTLEIGYRLGLYVDAIQTVHADSLVNPPGDGTIAVSSIDHANSNFGFNGPYLSANLSF